MANPKLNITIAAIDKTKGAFRAVTKSLGIASKALFSFKTAIVGAVGVGGLGLLVNQSLKSIDALGKTADKLGVTTEALGAMRYAAELTGVATRTTDMAMQRFTRRLSEAAAGTGEAKGALIELGINAKELSQLPLDDQMLALADAFTNVQSQSDRVRLAFKLFDSEGVALVSTLSKGREELAAMFNEAESLGILMSAEAAQGVEATNDALLRLTSLFGGIKDQIVAALAPALEKLATLIKDSVLQQIQALNGSVEAFGKQAANFILRAVAKILRGLADFTLNVQKVINTFETLVGKIEEFFGIIPEEKTNFQGLIDQFENAALVVDSLAFATRNFGVATQDNKPKVKELTDVVSEASAGFKKFADEAGSASLDVSNMVYQGMTTATDAITDLIMGTKSAADAFRNFATSIIRDMIRMQVQQNITAPLSNVFSSGISAIFGGGKAIGGSVQAGKPYMVGERGAEMFVPAQSGSIVANDELQSGGGSVNVTLNISTGVSQTVRAELMNMLPQIQNATKAAVVEAKRRGGGLASAFGG